MLVLVFGTLSCGRHRHTETDIDHPVERRFEVLGFRRRRRRSPRGAVGWSRGHRPRTDTLNPRLFRQNRSPTLYQCCTNVRDVGPTLTQNWAKDSREPGGLIRQIYDPSIFPVRPQFDLLWH